MAAQAVKRARDDIDEGEISDSDSNSPPTPKRTRRLQGAHPRHQHQNSAVDPTWGQKYVFSDRQDATTIPCGEEDDFEDDADAMAYLRSVRHEAHGISHLLVAPTRQIGPQLPPELEAEYDTGQNHGEDGDQTMNQYERGDYGEVKTETDNDTTAFYEDGAFIARSLPEKSHQQDQDQDQRISHLHEALFASTLASYRRLRRLLHAPPPPGAGKRLSVARPTRATARSSDPTVIKRWATALRNTDPHPLQLALMSKPTVLRVLHILLGGNLLACGRTLTERTSRWVWGLLARLPDPGELNHTELASVRDLGRRAVLLGRSLAEMAALRAELDDDAMGLHTGDVDSRDDDGSDFVDVDGHQESDDDDAADKEDKTDESTSAANQKLDDTHDGRSKNHETNLEQAADGDESAEMDLSSDGEQQPETATGPATTTTDTDTSALEAAKAALLNRIANSETDAETDEAVPPGGDDDEVHKDDHHSVNNVDEEAAHLRLRINMRATLSMILTVAGEFYGQRDLLEFREPFVGL